MAEQRSLTRQARCNRALSAVTQNVIVIEEGKVKIHAAFLMFASGQLRFLGSMPVGPTLNHQFSVEQVARVVQV